MKNGPKNLNRRKFIKQSSILAISTGGILISPHTALAYSDDVQRGINIIGPKEGFTPQIGTMVSMMNWMRKMILQPVHDMSQEDLDFLIDENANTIGAMLWHLAATERFYQIHTFEGRAWGDWSSKEKSKWSTASGLGSAARHTIKGNNIDFYLKKLSDVREVTLKEFAKRDDDWLMKVDKNWPWGPTNNYCKWFHVCEHESNHNGQFKFLKSRLPSAKK